MAADIPFMEVTGKKDVQNGGRSILKMTTGFGLFSSLPKVKIYFFLLFTSNVSYFNSFKLPYKIRLLGFHSPLNFLMDLIDYVPVKSKLQQPPPPGNPWAFVFFAKSLFKFPPPEAEKLFKCPIIDPFQVIKCPHPRETFR